jgi:hypothetical protein
MNKYRKLLMLGALAVMAMVYAGDWLRQNALQGPIQSRRDETARLESEIEKRENELSAARKAAKELAALELRSLPSNPEVARSLYQGWLLELVEYVKFANPNVDSGEPLSHKGLFRTIQCSVRGRGTLEQLTLFLYEFYSAGHLHQIRSINITPLQRSDELDLAIAVEALILPKADRPDQLTTVASDRLASAEFAEYQSIPQRNLFGVGGSPDPTDFAYLTAVNYVDGQGEAWFTLRSEDRVLKLRQGEPLEIGPFRGVIAAVSRNDVIVESEGERWLLTIGESLAQAFALPPEY